MTKRRINKVIDTGTETKNLVNAGVGVTVEVDWIKAAIAVTVAAVVIMATNFTFYILKKRV